MLDCRMHSTGTEMFRIDVSCFGQGDDIFHLDD